MDFRTKRIFIIAGESSGDILGGKLLSAVRSACLEKNLKFPELNGVGGPACEAQGLTSIFPIQDIAIMGFMEVASRFLLLKRRIKETSAAIIRLKPDVIISIDSPGFCARVLKKIPREIAKRIHYVAPSVWAYRPERAKTMESWCDAVMALLPFEPAYFTNPKMPCYFVGHPLVEDAKLYTKTQFRSQHSISKDTTILCLMPGSREIEVDRLWPIFADTMTLLYQQHQNLYVVIPTVQHLSNKISKLVEKLEMPCLVINNNEEKVSALAAANIALVKSGTSSLELAIAKVPMVVAYASSRVTAFLLRRMGVKTKYFSLVNILLGKDVIKEFIQEDCKPELLCRALIWLIRDKKLRDKQIAKFDEALRQLLLDQLPTPSARAAAIILKYLY